MRNLAREPLKVLVADDHPLFREGVIAALATDSQIVVIGQAEEAGATVQLARSLQPDVVLLDLSMPGDGLVAAKRITTTLPSARVIVLTALADEGHLVSAIQAGARGYVLKGVAAEELVDIIQSVHAGEVYVAPSLAFGLLREIARPRADDPLGVLAAREREVLELVARGLDNREIGERLGLAEQTVKEYMTGVLKKLRVRSRVEAAVLAARLRPTSSRGF